MLSVKIDDQKSIALFEPHGPLSEGDFKSAVEVVDPWIEKNGRLRGLIIKTRSFPGWETFGALSSHLSFVREHHKKIRRVAFVTDSVLGNIAENLAGHFVSAKIKRFPYESLEQATTWISDEGADSSA